jgi:hypothetical protein
MLTALLLLALPGQVENEIEYESYVPPKYEVLVFMATKCPMAKLYRGRLTTLADRYPQIHFQGVSVNENDTDEEIAAFQKDLRFGFGRNPEAITRVGATRSPEAALMMNGNILYIGRIDDQYAPGANRSAPTRNELEEAIKDMLAGRALSVSRSQATGCRISVSGQHGGAITFDHVAPIFYKHCADCHRPGEVAPFSLLTYEDASSWKNMIKEVVGNNRMPPWHADPKHGKFANDRSLSESERSMLIQWADAGAPPAKQVVPVPQFRSGWTIKTDVILKMAEPFAVPAEGVLDYQEFALDPGFKKDTWIQGIEVRPSNAAIVHHVNVFVRPKNSEKESVYYNSMQDLFFVVMVPGNTKTIWPEGIAKVIPADWDIVIAVHYQPNGSAASDQTSVALQLAEPSTIRKQIATRAILASNFVLPANEVTEMSNTWTLEDDYTIHALMPHMHLRGKSMRVEADGEVLLNVPQFDFNWQHRYVLAEPKQLKKGTVIVCTAVYDNTAANPNNPDPSVDVRDGRQSSDEMFQLNVEITRTSENLQPRRFNAIPVLSVLGLAFVGLCLGGKKCARESSSSCA